VRNGNNSILQYFHATNNPSLFCIQVDNETDANLRRPPYNAWQKDDFATYSEDCSTLELTYVPDDNFEQALIDLGYDIRLDDYVLTANISGVTFLNVSNPMTNPNLPNVTDKIADMTGIEDFISLTDLRCFDNELTSLDVSQNTALINLNCSNNQLTSLNVRNGNNSILQYFHATNNPSLFCIQVDNETDANFPLPPYDTWQKDDFATYSEDCSTLELTYVPDDNFEQALIDYGYDIGLNDYVLTSNISEVTSLDVSNQSIADLTGIEDFISLTFLNCGYNPLSSLDMSNNVALTTLICRYNQLKELEISQNTALTALVCISNNLSSLDVSQNISLIYLNCENNDLSSLDVSQNVALAHLQCGSNNIEVLDVSHNVALEQLWCGSNKLTNLDLSQNTALKLLYCSFNPLTQQLDVSNNTALEFIHCADIGLESLDVSLQPELFGLFCYINKLESLDLTNNPKLFELWCYNNRLAELNIKNGNNMNVTQFKANYNLLSCITVDDELFNHTGWITDPGVIFSNDCGYNTQRGESVEVLPVDETSQTTPVEVTFDAVNRSGNTSLATTDNGPEFPGGFAYGDPITYYDISTTAEFSGPVQIAIDYSGMVFANEEGLRLMHYENQQWNDVTTMLDTENDMIYGEVMMLSSFGIFEDIEPPVLIGVPADETVECNAIPTPAVVNAEDNVDGSVSVILSEETLGGSCPNSYTLVRTWTATDAAGNTSSASQIITVKDNTSPTLTVPADVTIECDMDNSPATTDMATATDNCDAAPVIVYSDEQIPGACANAYTINRTWSATDVCGNSASMVQVITIVDTEAPALTTPVDLTIECDMDSSPDATGYATTADNCDAAPVITYTDEQVVGSCANEYTINRIWMATDACSNVATAVQVISVIDVTIPVITEVPTAPIVKGNDAGSCGAFIDYPEITATDNCSDPVNLTLDPLSGSFFTVGSTTVTVTAVDDCGNTVTADFDVEITNEIPVIENLVAPVDPVQLGVIVNTSAVFTDNNLSGAVWDWGDGTSSAGIIEGQTITGDHLYEMPGVYILTLTITDMCGQTDTEIYQYVVVYDPNGGFITGGGWINSPPGAYVDDPLLEGKANFGFVSKYKKGEDIPEGNTEFQFSAGNLKFKSTSYYWLVIAGSKAKFKGDGSVNNTGDYGFIISAIDGDLKDNGEVDRFRIKIWDVVDETVIYDNEIESDENEDPTTQLGGGSIVIHIPKTKGSGIFNEELVSFESDGYNEPTMLIYPNPAKDNINIIVSGKEEQTIQLKIYNSTGQLIYISSGKGMINEEISLKDNKSGLYSVIAVVEGKLIIQKVLIE
jgi:Leucine-rich repeat (LRR) protein